MLIIFKQLCYLSGWGLLKSYPLHGRERERDINCRVAGVALDDKGEGKNIP